MFCDEPILHVYQRMYCEDKEQPWHNAILRLTGSFEYHATEGYWLVFQTVHFVISLGYDGVQVYNNMADFCIDDELRHLIHILRSHPPSVIQMRSSPANWTGITSTNSLHNALTNYL